MNPVVALPGTSAAWQNSWKDALDAVQLDLEDVEYLLDQLHASAEARVEAAERLLARSRRLTLIDPALGSPPMDQVARAKALLARQVSAAGDLARAMAVNRRHARVAAAMQQRPAAAVPVYIDTEA